MQPVLSDFRSLQPAHMVGQRETYAWLAAAHTRAEATRSRELGIDFDESSFHTRMLALIERLGSEHIERRGLEIDDCVHTRWAEMEIYRLEERATGESAELRTHAFARKVEGALHRLYAERSAPNDLVHVTCTGYASPSPAQRMIAARGWYRQTRVTHAYHMGCYAALPALRTAVGLLHVDRSTRAGEPRRTDVVHTELSSLHVNPLAHSPEQLVIQTLFADGFIGYSVSDRVDRDPRDGALALLASDEELVPDSSEAMQWFCSQFGMQMRLARDVPELLASHLEGFVARLLERAGLGRDARRSAVFAVHPGGPKILDAARRVLDLREDQLAFSRKVLREHGNMSSATLPHVWLEIVRAERVLAATPVVSLAFGPGLTLCGAVMEKVA